MKYTLISTAVTLLILYIGTGFLLLSDYGANKAFNPGEQINTWLFVFGWSMGKLGYVLMAFLILLFFVFIRWLILKISNKVNPVD